MKSYLVCEDIIKIYPQETKVKKATLRGIHLNTREGEFISILGPSGCGKTTLLLIMAGLIEPSAGLIKIGDQLVNELSANERIQFYRNNIGLMYQNPQANVIWDLNAFDNILLPMVFNPALRKENKHSQVKTLLKRLKIDHKASKKPNQLSGGELQRLGLAIAFANDPELILLDEPTSQLDSKAAWEIVNYLRVLCTEQKKTIFMVTHDLRLIKQTNKCYLMKEGQLTEIQIKNKTKAN